jgi:putative hemolysin
VVDILTAKRFYEFLAGDMAGPLHSVLYPPIFMPETMRANAVLNTFKREKQYMGIVVDEYGTTEGVITVYDILEAIVGDMPDLDEVEEPEIVRREDGSLLVSGSVEVHELNRELRQEVIRRDPDSYATLAGFLSYTLGRFSASDEKVPLNGYELEIVDMDGFRVDKVILKRKECRLGKSLDCPVHHT